MPGAVNPTDSCLLHIPYRNVGAQLVAELKKMLPEDAPLSDRRKLDTIGRHIDDNFAAVEQWVDRFYKECICDCGGGEG